MTEKKIRVGIIGTGKWAKDAHLPALFEDENVVVAGLVNRTPSRAKSMADELNLPYYETLGEMLEQADLDVLDVITSRGTHYEPVMAGIEKGLSILCEKPLGHSLKEARELYRAAKAKDLVTHIGFTFRYSPAVRYMRDLILSGFCGEIYQMQGFEENMQLISPETPLPRLGFSPKTDSGALHGFGSHLIDVARWTLGEIEEVVGNLRTCIHERPILHEPGQRLKVEVDDTAAVLAVFESGVQSVMQFSKVAVGNAPGFEMRVFGSKAALWVRLEVTSSGYDKLWIADTKNGNFRPLDIPSQYYEGRRYESDWPSEYFAALIRDYLRKVRSNDRTEGTSDFLDGLRTQEIMEAIECSCRERRIVRLSEITSQEF